MAECNVPRLVIAGVSSGVGKTTIVTGLLAALTAQGLKVQSYKVGPDYIDPGYHRIASGRPAHNLDSWLVPAEQLPRIFAATAKEADIAVIEGVMGLFDGGRQGVSSTAAIAKLLGAPVVLTVDARSAGESVAAVVHGFNTYDPELRLAGVIVNRLGSSSHREMVTAAVERIGLRVYGSLMRDDHLAVSERHLGLTPVTENDAYAAVNRMGEIISREADVAGLVKLAGAAPALFYEPEPPLPGPPCVRIGVADDAAFSFYYPESLSVLRGMGAEIVPFSPLADPALPDVDGLIFGGGFPEMFLDKLAGNESMLRSLRGAARDGMPIYAECGGLMYLCRQLIFFDGRGLGMAGIIPADCAMQQRLETVGYVEAKSLGDNVLAAPGGVLRGHEFHFSRMIPCDAAGFPWAFEFTKMRTGAQYLGGFASGNILASYLHMHFAGNPGAAARFLDRCATWRFDRE